MKRLTCLPFIYSLGVGLFFARANVAIMYKKSSLANCKLHLPVLLKFSVIASI